MESQNAGTIHHDIAVQCVNYVVNSNALDEWEFETRLGVSRAELRDTLEKLHQLHQLEVTYSQDYSILNCFNEVCNGLHISDEEWNQWFNVTKSEICSAFAHLKGLKRVGETAESSPFAT